MDVTYDPQERDRVRSLWLHRAVLNHLVSDPGQVLDRAQKVLERRLAKPDYNGSARPYDERWLDILRSGVEATAALLVAESDESDVLRSCSPFSGVLSVDERRQVLDDFEAFWRRQSDQVVVG